jgi:hypothetical protein
MSVADFVVHSAWRLFAQTDADSPPKCIRADHSMPCERLVVGCEAYGGWIVAARDDQTADVRSLKTE